MSTLSSERLHNADELAHYQSLSTLAVLALVLGLCSPLTFLGPLAFVVPFMAIAVALLAIARIDARDSLTGRSLALVAIVLAVLFSTAALARVFTRNALSVHHADAVARRWLALVSAGDANAALEIMTPDALMGLQPSPKTPDEPRPPFDRAKAEAKLGGDPLVRALAPAQMGSAVTLQLHNEQFFWGERDAQVGCKFLATGARIDPLEGGMVLSRKATPEGGFAWLVNTWNLTSLKPTEADAHHHQ